MVKFFSVLIGTGIVVAVKAAVATYTVIMVARYMKVIWL